MRFFNRVSYLLVLIAGVQLACTDRDVETEKVHADAKLTSHILDCEDITEKAAAHLKAVVEFQKLEIAGRKAHVFKQCMHDRGYIENPEWLTDSKKNARSTAQKSQISIDEAIENLRRLHMQQSEWEAGRPHYWVVKD